MPRNRTRQCWTVGAGASQIALLLLYPSPRRSAGTAISLALVIPVVAVLLAYQEGLPLRAGAACTSAAVAAWRLAFPLPHGIWQGLQRGGIRRALSLARLTGVILLRAARLAFLLGVGFQLIIIAFYLLFGIGVLFYRIAHSLLFPSGNF